MRLPQIVLLDRDATINLASSDPASPLYYVLDAAHLVIKPGVKQAIEIIRVHGINPYLVTKQRCISKGLLSHERLAIIHARLQRLLDVTFEDILVEPEAENKRALYEAVLRDHRGSPADIHLFDDSESERTIAARMGITVHDGSDLYKAVCAAFGVR